MPTLLPLVAAGALALAAVSPSPIPSPAASPAAPGPGGDTSPGPVVSPTPAVALPPAAPAAATSPAPPCRRTAPSPEPAPEPSPVPSPTAKLGFSVGPDPLWDKAVAVAAQNEDWLPGRWDERQETLGAGGRVLGVLTRRISIGPGPEGALEVRLVRATRDGRDVTAGEREVLEDEKARFEETREEDNPFLRAVQGRVDPMRLNRMREIDGRVCAALAYGQRTADGEWMGTAWIEDETGLPVELQRKPRPDEGIPEVLVTTRYGSSPDGGWFPVEVVTETAESPPARGASARRTRTTVALSGHWRRGEKGR